MAAEDEVTPEEYVRAYRAKRGYLRRFPVVMAYADADFQAKIGQLADHAYAAPRRLSAREKELILTAVLAAGRAGREHLEMHMRKALEMGLDARDVLEALELIVVPCGITAFENAVEILNDVAGFCPRDVLEETVVAPAEGRAGEGKIRG